MLRSERKRRIAEYRALPDRRRFVSRKKTKPGVGHRKTGCKAIRRIIRGHVRSRPWSLTLRARCAESRRGWMRKNKIRRKALGLHAIRWRVYRERNAKLSRVGTTLNIADKLAAHPDAPWNQ